MFSRNIFTMERIWKIPFSSMPFIETTFIYYLGLNLMLMIICTQRIKNIFITGRKILKKY